MKKRPAQSQNKKTFIQSKWFLPSLTGVLLLVLLLSVLLVKKPSDSNTTSPEPKTPTEIPSLPAEHVQLPSPDLKSGTSLESTLKNRRSRRAFLNKSLTLKQVSQMLWSAQGVTSDWGGRTAPSAKSTYPLSLYLIANNVDGLDSGEYQYVPGDRTPVHQLKIIKKGNLGQSIFEGINQNSFKDAPAIIVITGNMLKMSQAFGGVSMDRDVYLEAGHAAQNLYLQAESLKLGMVTVSSAKDNIVRNIISIPDEETLIYMIPFGYPKE